MKAKYVEKAVQIAGNFISHMVQMKEKIDS